MNNKLRELLEQIVHNWKDSSYYCESITELESVLTDPAWPWTALAEGKHEAGIRYIGASGTHVLGDVFYGRGRLTVGRMGEEGYGERQMVECWRYTESHEQLPDHFPLTHWQELPDSPVPQKTYEPFIFSDSPDGAAAEAVYLRQVAAEDKFNGQ